jgi:hypothetical protein
MVASFEIRSSVYLSNVFSAMVSESLVAGSGRSGNELHPTTKSVNKGVNSVNNLFTI